MNRVYDLYEVRGKTRSHHEWKSLGKRKSYWIKKDVQPKWWQFWKSKFRQVPPDDLEYLQSIFDAASTDDKYVEAQFVGWVTIHEQGGSYLHPVVIQSVEIPLHDHVCWKCKKSGATIKTASQPPDNEEWWFHEQCYWDLQDILYG